MYVTPEGEDEIAVCDHCGYSVRTLQTRWCLEQCGGRSLLQVHPQWVQRSWLYGYLSPQAHGRSWLFLFPSRVATTRRTGGLFERLCIWLDCYQMRIEMWNYQRTCVRADGSSRVYIDPQSEPSRKPNPTKINRSGTLTHMWGSQNPEAVVHIVGEPVKLEHNQIPTDIKVWEWRCSWLL